MSRRQAADAASRISPFVLTDSTTAASPPPSDLPPPASSGNSGKQGKTKKARAKDRSDRHPTVDEERRFNTGPPRNPSSRAGRRQNDNRFFGRLGLGYGGVPDYPPPSFQDVVNCPPDSQFGSTTSLPYTPVPQPMALPSHVAFEGDYPRSAPATVTTFREQPCSENESDSDYSLEVIERESIPTLADDLPAIGSERRSRHALFDFPPHSTGITGGTHILFDRDPPNRGRMASRDTPVLRVPVNLDPQAVSSEDYAQASPTSPKRRILSLSPLRTLLPHKPSSSRNTSFSAHPLPSQSFYTPSRSNFFRSTLSLSNPSFLRFPNQPVDAGKSEVSLTRRLFSHKPKSRSYPETWDEWEVVNDLEDEIDPFTPTDSQYAASPGSTAWSVGVPERQVDSPLSRGQSLSFGAAATLVSSPDPPPIITAFSHRSPDSPRLSPTIVWRDSKSSPAFVDRKLKRNATAAATYTPPPVPKIPKPSVNASPPGVDTRPVAFNDGPPLTTVRVREKAPISSAPSSPPIKPQPPAFNPSPLRIDSAISYCGVVIEDPTPTISDSGTQVPAVQPPSVRDGRRTPDRAETSPSHVDSNPAVHCCHCPVATLSPSHLTADAIEPTKRKDSGSPNRLHYSGRPLPRPPSPGSPPPPAAIEPVHLSITIEASPEPIKPARLLLIQPTLKPVEPKAPAPSTCPEGLLIDLDDTTLDQVMTSGPPSPAYSIPVHPSDIILQQMESPDSPDSEDDISMRSIIPMSVPPTPPAPSNPLPSNLPPSNPPLRPLEMTDFDLLLANLDPEHSNGNDYDNLLLVSEILGPATPPPDATPPLPFPRSSSPNSDDKNISLLGRVEVVRRRKTKDGRTKIKLSLLGVGVDKCGVCLSQFKDEDMAGLTSVCRHAFHEKCLGRWLVRRKNCPLCRVPLDVDVR